MLPAVEFDGHPRVLSVLPDVGEHDMPLFRGCFDAPAVVAESDLDYGIPIEDQGRTSACGGFSTGGALELLLAVETMGQQIVRLSRTFVYSKVNGGRDQGTTIEALLMAAKRFGCCPHGAFPHDCLFAGQGDPRADELAAGFRLEQGYRLTTADEVLSALAMRKPVVMGVTLGGNFDRVDGDGVSPPPDRPRGGHALLAKRVFLSKRYGPCVGGPNSWGPRFGVGGNYLVPVDPYLTAGPVQAFALGGLCPDRLV